MNQKRVSLQAPAAAEVGIDGVRGAAAGIRAYLEAMVGISQAKTAEERAFREEQAAAAAQRLAQQRQDWAEGAPERAKEQATFEQGLKDKSQIETEERAKEADDAKLKVKTDWLTKTIDDLNKRIEAEEDPSRRSDLETQRRHYEGQLGESIGVEPFKPSAQSEAARIQEAQETERLEKATTEIESNNTAISALDTEIAELEGAETPDSAAIIEKKAEKRALEIRNEALSSETQSLDDIIKSRKQAQTEVGGGSADDTVATKTLRQTLDFYKTELGMTHEDAVNAMKRKLGITEELPPNETDKLIDELDTIDTYVKDGRLAPDIAEGLKQARIAEATAVTGGAKPSASQTMGDAILAYGQSKGLTRMEMQQVLQYNKGILNTLSTRNYGAWAAVQLMIDELAEMPAGEGRVAQWRDEKVKGWFSPEMEPFVPLVVHVFDKEDPSKFDAREFVFGELVKTAKADGDWQPAIRYILSNTFDRAKPESRREIQGLGLLTQASMKTLAALEKFEQHGINVGRLDGLGETLNQKIRGITNEQVRLELEAEANILRDMYVLIKSGAAVTDTEYGRTAKQFLDAMVSEDFNAATMRGNVRAARDRMLGFVNIQLAGLHVDAFGKVGVPAPESMTIGTDFADDIWTQAYLGLVTVGSFKAVSEIGAVKVYETDDGNAATTIGGVGFEFESDEEE